MCCHFAYMFFVVSLPALPNLDWLEAYCFLPGCSSVRLFMHYQTCEHHILKVTDSDANWHKWSTGHGHETVNIGGQEVNCQGPTMLK